MSCTYSGLKSKLDLESDFAGDDNREFTMQSMSEKGPILPVVEGASSPEHLGHGQSKITEHMAFQAVAEHPETIPLNQTVSKIKGLRKRINTLEGQSGTLRTSKSTLHGDLRIRDRIHHFTLAWFISSMSTGGIALLLSQTPHRFSGLTTIGTIFFLLTIILFISYTITITTRFILYPKSLGQCVTHPTESLFFPTFWISISNIISNIQAYGVPHCGVWLITTLKVIFWIYTALTFSVAVGQYYFLFTGKPLTIQSMTPQWILPIFPIMLCGTLASLLSSTQPVEAACPMMIAGLTFQGLGMMMATFMYGPFLRRLMTAGLPSPNTRPGMFIAVGPPSFTGLVLLGISKNLYRIFPAYTTFSAIQNPSLIPDIFRVFAVSVSIFLWATAFWFFCIAFVSVIHGSFFEPNQGMSFHLVWWAFIFPNVGFTVCTISIGEALMSESILWVGSAMTIVLVGMWGVCATGHVRAVYKKQILWPGKDEDHDQKGWKEDLMAGWEEVEV